MATLPPIVILCAGSLALASSVWWLFNFIRGHNDNPNGLPFPPGPKGYPIIGSLLEFPSKKPWLAYKDWSKLYGDMFFFRVLGQPFLVLDTTERTFDLCERRSSKYSDRPRHPMLNEVIDWTWAFGFMRYGSVWRRHRRTFHDHFHPNIIHLYHPILINTTRDFLSHLLEAPDNFVHHIRHAFTSTIVKIVYGFDVKDRDDDYVTKAEITLSGLAAAGYPGAFLVDTFPIMKYIPEWFPGAGWKRKGKRLGRITSMFVNNPWEEVKKKMKEGNATPCVAATLIENLPENSLDRAEAELVSRNVCAIAFAGGADSTVSTLQSFFLAMALYPEVQKKAQAEVDGVLGGRLPEFNDRIDLPYINALVKESMRWQVVAPLAAAHKTTEGDEYNGYFIPKGTIVIGNTWSILHNPEIYPDPFNYNPDRFLKDGRLDQRVPDPKIAFFGFGRRICPGRFLSEDSMFILMAHILTVYDIRPAMDGDGNNIEIKPIMTDGFLSYPEPFNCRITPRSKEAEHLIRNL